MNVQMYRFKYKIIIIVCILSISLIIRYNSLKNKDTFIPILMYHNIEQKPQWSKITYSIEPTAFKSHIHALKQSGYNTITVSDLVEYKEHNRSLPKKPILLTFDDGKTNNYEYAYPLLKELDMKGTIFCISHVPQDKVHNYLEWDKLKEMYDSSVMDIQSHTHNLHYKIKGKHRIFKNSAIENKYNYRERILNDFVLSKDIIEQHIGNKVVGLAYPYGKYNKSIEEIAVDAGYKATFTTNIGVMRKTNSLYKIKRINIDGLCSENRLLLEIKLLEIFSMF